MEIIGIVGLVIIVVTVFSIEIELKKLVKQNERMIDLLEKNQDKK
ncbi:hypothetical protein J2S09_000880 [Bacillus fengqiuensis]|nr:hypothetical protein [Bacillus fengqiuensis]